MGSLPPPRGFDAERHGGNRTAVAARLGCRPQDLLDASASLVPFGPPPGLQRRLQRACRGLALREYPDRAYTQLRQALASHHGLDPDWVLPGNGAAELFTWAGRDAAAAGLSLLPTPGFADYPRALSTWGGPWAPLPLPLSWREPWPQSFPDPDGVRPGQQGGAGPAGALWITNPHNPTGQLWSQASLAALLPRFALVIADEAFLPLLPGGEEQSLVPLLARYPNLVVIRSLTKLVAIAGLRLGYALGSPERLQRWAAWRDPWPVNGLAALAGEAVINDQAWRLRVQGWLAREGPWLQAQLAALPGLVPLPSAANFLLVRAAALDEREAAAQPAAVAVSLEPLRRALESRDRILLRDCRSFAGLGPGWLRIGLQQRRDNRRIVEALRRELAGWA